MVRFTKGPLGGGKRWERIVKKGDEGTYLGPHPLAGRRADLDDWHLIECKQDGETFEVPVFRAQFERATASTATAKRIREDRVNEYLAEVRRAVHDGEWAVALSEVEMLGSELAAIVERDGGQS